MENILGGSRIREKDVEVEHLESFQGVENIVENIGKRRKLHHALEWVQRFQNIVGGKKYPSWKLCSLNCGLMFKLIKQSIDYVRGGSCTCGGILK